MTALERLTAEVITGEDGTESGITGSDCELGNPVPTPLVAVTEKV